MQKYQNRLISALSIALLLYAPWVDGHYYILTFLGAFLLGGIAWKLDDKSS